MAPEAAAGAIPSLGNKREPSVSNIPMCKTMFALLALAATVGLSSCGGDAMGPGGNGSASGNFVLTISGDVSSTIRGDEGGFWEITDTQTQEKLWVLSLSAGEAAALEGLQVLVGGPRPAPGEYLLSSADPEDLEDGEGVAFAVVNPTVTEPGFVGLSISGSVTITESSAEVVRGTLLISAQGSVFPFGGQGTPGSVAIDGSFRALLTVPELPEPSEPPTTPA